VTLAPTSGPTTPTIFESSFERITQNATIGGAGGTVVVDRLGSLMIPPDIFIGSQNVELFVSRDSIAQELILDISALFNASIVMDRQVVVSLGNEPPRDVVHLSVSIPSSFLSQVPSGHQIELIGQVRSSSDLDSTETYDIIASTYDTISRSLTAEISGSFFDLGRADRPNAYSTRFSVIATPGINRGESNLKNRLNFKTTDECGAVSIICPLRGGCVVTSRFQPARLNPETGVFRAHQGVDYLASNGTEVLAAADGYVELVKREMGQAGPKGYGRYIIIRHSNGSSTRYAHLQEFRVSGSEKEPVFAGQVIGLSDNDGGSRGPHLHFEYIPNGRLFRSKSNIDPHLCVGATAEGSIKFGDNGSLLDDVFELAIDGVVIGRTMIGTAQSIAVGNLISGTRNLRVTAVVAPDNIGTFFVNLKPPLSFVDGGVTRSGSIEQGGTATYSVIVP
jgi:murein DD-endopeptidase MepM/ murein hydrolase activator NlpD